MPDTKPRTRLYLLLGAAAIAGLALAGFSSIRGASVHIDPAKLVVVERGTMVRSVVATGKVEPITKVEIKSKANGIIKALAVDVDSVVAPGDVLAELDKDQLLAQVRGARASLLAAEAALEGAEAQLRKNMRRSSQARRMTLLSTSKAGIAGATAISREMRTPRASTPSARWIPSE